MKKAIFVFVLFVSINNYIYSQDTPVETTLLKTEQTKQGNEHLFKSFRIGLFVNTAVDWLKPKAAGYSRDGSYIVAKYGLMADFFFTPNYAFTTGLDISYYGGKLKYNDDVTINGQFHPQYLDIPLAFKMKREIGYFSYFAQVGLSFGFRLNSTENWNYTGANIPATNSGGSNVDIIDNTNFLRCAFIVEGGIEYSLRQNASIVCALTFNNGLTHLINTDYNNITMGQFGASNAITNSLGITVGLFF